MWSKVQGQDCGCSAAVGEWTFGLFSAVGAATRNTTTGVSKSRRKRPVRNPDVGVVQHRWVNEPLFGLVAAWHTVMGPAFSDIRVHFLPTKYLEQAVNVPAIRVTATPRSLCGRIDFPRTPLIKQEPRVRGSRWSRLEHYWEMVGCADRHAQNQIPPGNLKELYIHSFG